MSPIEHAILLTVMVLYPALILRPKRPAHALMIDEAQLCVARRRR
jgi:hypothetical protein